MPSLQEQQAPIDTAIVNAMIESTPETWHEIILTLVRKPGSSSIGGFTHELSSPEGYPPVGAADSLYEATYKLDDLLQGKAEKRISKAVYRVKSVGERWSFNAEFEYA